VNVLLIAIDTLRADHLGCYGYPRPTSPHIDVLARQSVVFEQAFATSIPTHPAFTTILSGQHALSHGVVAHGGTRGIAHETPWLPALLQGAGYTTCAVDNLAAPLRGFGRGFEFQIDPSQRRPLGINCDNRELNARAIPWLEHHGRDEKFFLFIHYWDPHTPYLPPRAYRSLFYEGDPFDRANRSLEGMEAHPLGKMWRETWFSTLGGHVTEARYIEALYDAEIRYVSEGVQQVLDTLDRLGLTESTLVVLLADHGEMMFRHGIFFDHHGLYDGNIHVPLIIRAPGARAARVDHLVTHADVAPTILAWCGVPVPPAMDGHSLAPYLRGDAQAPLRDEVLSQECTWQAKWALRTTSHKLIMAREADFYGTPMRELYDLEADPQELRNVADDQPEVAACLEARLVTRLRDMLAARGLHEDPLLTQGISLGQAWKAPQEPK
jgi:arylsulfatase